MGVLDGGLSCATSDFVGRNLDHSTHSPLVGYGRSRSKVLIFLDPGVRSEISLPLSIRSAPLRPLGVGLVASDFLFLSDLPLLFSHIVYSLSVIISHIWYAPH